LHFDASDSIFCYQVKELTIIKLSYIRELTQRVETLERERQGHQQADGSPSSPAPPVPSQDVTFFGLSELGQASPAGYPQTGIKRSLSISADETSSRTGVPPEARSGAITLSPALLSRYTTPFFASRKVCLISTLRRSASNELFSYYAYLHPNFPFLPADGEDINLLLSQGQHASVRAFMQAFEFCMHSVQYTGQHTPNIHQLSRHLYDIYNGCKWEDPANILQLYTALLLVVESINRGTSTYLSRAGQDPWIYMRDLVSMAITHNLFVEALQASTQDENGFRRLSLCISVLDTFLAFANRKEGLATAGCEVGSLPRPEDKDAFGYRLFELNRITRIIRQLQDVQISESPSEIDFQAPTVQGAKPRLHFGPQDVAILRTLKAKDIELLQSIQLTFNYSEDTVVGMAFWYARILVELHYWPEASASALLYSCRRLIEIFATLTVPNIYTHHFSGLAAHTLFQLCDFSNTKDEAIPLLDLLGDALNQLIGSADSESFDAGIRNAVERKRQSLRSANLEHLAAVAVGKSDGSGGGVAGSADQSVAEAAAAAAQAALGGGEFTGAKMSKEGYLTAVLS
jgi:hypothetical protein